MEGIVDFILRLLKLGLSPLRIAKIYYIADPTDTVRWQAETIFSINEYYISIGPSLHKQP